MSFDSVPHNHSSAGGIGAEAGSPITISGIKSTDVLWAVVKHKQGEGAEAVGLDCSDFTPADGAIESASVSTDGYFVEVAWTTPTS